MTIAQRLVILQLHMNTFKFPQQMNTPYKVYDTPYNTPNLTYVLHAASQAT